MRSATHRARGRTIAAGGLAVAWLLAAAPALAQESPTTAIRALIEDVRYEEAIAAARHALEQPGVRARDYDAVLELMATAQLAIRDTRGANQTLATLYGRDPGHRLSDQDPSPVVQAAFARARNATHAPPTVAISATAEHEASAFTVVGHLAEGANLVDEVRLSFRTHGGASFVQVVVPLEADGTARARTPRDDQIPGEYVVEYYLEAFAPSQTLLASAGSATAPLTVTIPARPIAPLTADVVGTGTRDAHHAPAQGGGSVVGEWWFWTIIGVVLVGAGVGAYFAFGPPSQGPPGGDLGVVTLN